MNEPRETPASDNSEQSQPAFSVETLKNNHVTVELGCGSLALPMTASKDRFTKNNKYIGIELPPKIQKAYGYGEMDGIAEAKKLLRLVFGKEIPANINFVYGNMNRLPLPDQCADDVFIANVLNDPSLTRNGYKFRDTFSESRRILKPGGRLIVYTDSYPYDRDPVEDLIKENGFEIKTEYLGEDPEDLKFIQNYCGDIHTGKSQHLIIAEPKVDSK